MPELLKSLHSFPAMGCLCTVEIFHECQKILDQVILAVEQEVLRLDRTYSRYRAESLTTQINRTGHTGIALEVDTEMQGLLQFADQCYQQTGGLFDITSGVLRRVWDFKSGRLPKLKDLEDCLQLVGWDKVDWQSPFVQLTYPGMELDFGGYVKEYAVDCAITICRDGGVVHGLVDFGGDIGVIGPHPDGTGWRIGIRNPREPESAIAMIVLESGCLASSGDYERFFISEGKRYCHILNPHTGWPAQLNQAVSVIADQCVLAGMISTVAMLQSEIDAKSLLEGMGLNYVLVTDIGELITKTGGLSSVRQV